MGVEFGVGTIIFVCWKKKQKPRQHQSVVLLSTSSRDAFPLRLLKVKVTIDSDFRNRFQRIHRLFLL
jgi:hypothetical protein